MNKFLIIAIVLVIIIAGLVSMRLFLVGDEDAWVCVDGEWQMHGHPDSPKPEKGCPEDSTDDDDEIEPVAINSFEDCEAAGYPVMESYPRQCRVEGGKLFVEQIAADGEEMTYNDMIRLFTPGENQVISSPLVVEGEARGNWFFEASFPVILTDWDGLIIAEGIAQAEGEWMTEDFVPFRAELEFENPGKEISNRGALILKKDNPSGLPENDDALEITVFYE